VLVGVAQVYTYYIFLVLT